jgi:hypothetical protein
MEIIKVIAGLFVLLFLCSLPLGSWELLRSVVKPKLQDRLHWYDRALRAIGVLILMAFFVYLVIAVERE